MSATYLKLHIETEGGCRMKTKLYGKKRWYMFQNVKFQFRCCNIPASIAHELCISPKTYSNPRLVTVSSYHEKGGWFDYPSATCVTKEQELLTHPETLNSFCYFVRFVLLNLFGAVLYRLVLVHSFLWAMMEYIFLRNGVFISLFLGWYILFLSSNIWIPKLKNISHSLCNHCFSSNFINVYQPIKFISFVYTINVHDI